MDRAWPGAMTRWWLERTADALEERAPSGCDSLVDLDLVGQLGRARRPRLKAYYLYSIVTLHAYTFTLTIIFGSLWLLVGVSAESTPESRTSRCKT